MSCPPNARAPLPARRGLRTAILYSKPSAPGLHASRRAHRRRLPSRSPHCCPFRRLRADEERTRFTPVVIPTSSRQPPDVAEGRKLGANSCVEAVRGLGLYRLLMNEPRPADEEAT